MIDRIKLLVSDEDEACTRGIKLELETSGRYEVRQVSQVFHTVQAVREFHPDVIVLNPISAGRGLCSVAAQLRRDVLLRGVPIVLVGDSETRRAAREDGLVGICDAPLSKPYDCDQLVEAVQEALRAVMA